MRRGAPALIVAMALLCVGLTVSTEARAELPQGAGSVWGGEVDLTNRGALSVGAGWPSFFVRYDFHTSGRFGIGLQSDFYYGFPVGGWSAGLGFGFSVPMRIQVLSRGDWALSVMLDPGIFMGGGGYWHNYYTDDSFLVGPKLELGLIASVRPVRFLNIFFGLRTGVDIVVYTWENHGSFVDVWVPVLPFGGIELQVSRSVALFMAFHVGPAINSGSACTHRDRDDVCDRWDRHVGVGFAGRFMFGATFFF